MANGPDVIGSGCRVNEFLPGLAAVVVWDAPGGG
jgi:hypothetical protein